MEHPARSGVVHLVGAGPGDPGLLTVRGRRLLETAEVVVHDRLVDASVLALASPEAELVDVGKRPGKPGSGVPGQREINQLLIRHATAGRRVVRLKGGDPYVLGRGGEEAQALSRAGVAWEVVPGVSSAFAVAAAAGIPVTFRGVASAVTVTTGQAGHGGSQVDWAALANVETLVVLMGMATRAEMARQLQAAGRPPDTPVAVVQWGTTPRQRVERTTLDRLAACALGPPAIVVVGPAAAIDIGQGQLPRRLQGWSVVVTRPPGRARALNEALVEAGAAVIPLPVTAVMPAADGGRALRQSLGHLDRFAWVVLTSVNAVSALVDALLEVADLRALHGVRLAAVGPVTAAALRDHGLKADLVAEQASAAQLVTDLGELAGADDEAARAVLFPAANAARPEVEEGLTSRGWQVERVEAYRTVSSPAPPAPVTASAARADAVVFASPSAIRAWDELRDGEGEPLARPPVAACLGETTAEAARGAGWPHVLVAGDPRPETLVQLLGGESPGNLAAGKQASDSESR